jgi:PD-(D/E)XK nuclease superfamily
LIIPTDRSRISDTEKCDRLRWWRYEAFGTGIEQPGQWLDPLIGTAVHNGVEALLQGLPLYEAVARAIGTIDRAQSEGPILIFRLGPDHEADIAEAKLLAEALIRGWAMVRLPKLMAEFEVIAVEREMHKDFEFQGHTIRLLTRSDIVMRRKSDGSIFIRNLKTASRVDDKWRSKWRYDMSTFSEALAVEEALGEPVAGTIMEGFIKGSREAWPKGSGDYHWSSPLIRPWKQDGEPPMTQDRWAAKYEWRCTAPHGFGRGKACPGNREHRLSGYHKASVSEFPDGVKGWIEYLFTNDRATLEEQFVELTPILRSPYEIERWKRMKLPIEVDIREHRDYLLEPHGAVYPGVDVNEDLLDRWFPMSTADGNCVWPSECQFFSVCHGVAGDDLVGNGFSPRRANHPTEFEES